MISLFGPLSLQKKMLSAFSFVALICLLVGLAGLWGSSQLKRSLATISENDVPALEAILTLSKALEEMKSSERTLLDGTLSLQQRQIEYELISSARTVAEQAITTVGSQQHGDDGQLWKSFTNEWNSWLPQLQVFLDLSRKYDAAQISNPAALALQAQQKLSSYQSWAIQLSENIMDAVEISVEKDPLNTEIGQWVQQLKSPNTDISAARTELLQQLKSVGDSMTMIFDYFEIEEPELAQETYTVEIKPSVIGVEESIKMVLEPIEQALGLQRTMQTHALTISAPVLNQAQQKLKKLIAASRQSMANSTTEAATTAGQVSIVLWASIVIGIFSAIILGFILTRSITRPLTQTVNMLEDLERGHINKRLNLTRRDEIGRMANALDRFADSLQNEMVQPLQQLAHGDLTFEVTPRDEKDMLRSALQKLGTDLNEMISQIMVSGDQITSGSNQVADSSQSLSQGATESAASLEEISSSMNEIGSQTNHSAENAQQANQLASDAAKAAENGNLQMNQMVSAMSEINESGKSIGKIIKVIDEIAFQTNLLALNAAVEAARAGQHGKGFAVVAEEVRNLAARSAKAASETAELIEGSVAKAANGTQIAQRTSEALQKIVGEITKVSDLLSEISTASKEQATGVSQVNQGLQQIDQVIQKNTASAEESASTSEELSAQAVQMQQMLQRFTLKKGSKQIITSQYNEIEPQPAATIGWKGMTVQLDVAENEIS